MFWMLGYQGKTLDPKTSASDFYSQLDSGANTSLLCPVNIAWVAILHKDSDLDALLKVHTPDSHEHEQ